MPDSIIERLTKASWPDRELFYEAYQLCFGTLDPLAPGNYVRVNTFMRFLDAGAWTDAALTLMPEGWAWFVEWIGAPFSEGMVRLWIPAQRTQGLKVESIQVTAATPALALLIAIMKARG